MHYRIERYGNERKAEWDAFVTQSRNGSFLLYRDYMEYHSDRFTDHSLMFFNDARLVAVLPANISGSALYSHQGLTYGGLVTGFDVPASETLLLFEELAGYCRGAGIGSVYYKPIPTVYHKAPAQDDEYALWRCGAVLDSCNLGSVTDLECRETRTARRKSEYFRQLSRQGYHACPDADLKLYWQMLESHLKERYDAAPVHTYQEISLLQSRFRENIRCIAVFSPDGVMLGGVLAFLNGKVFRMQYSCSCDMGMKSGAMAFLMEWILNYCRENGFRYFDMGTSNELQGRVLNDSLEYWKWSFGGRGVACKTYLLKL